MNLTFHILKKDIYRLRVFLIFWLLTVPFGAGTFWSDDWADFVIKSPTIFKK